MFMSEKVEVYEFQVEVPVLNFKKSGLYRESQAHKFVVMKLFDNDGVGLALDEDYRPIHAIIRCRKIWADAKKVGSFVPVGQSKHHKPWEKLYIGAIRKPRSGEYEMGDIRRYGLEEISSLKEIKRSKKWGAKNPNPARPSGPIRPEETEFSLVVNKS